MHKPFDITTKQIVDTDPLAWIRFLGLPGESAELVDTDIAITAQADRLIKVTGGVDPYLLNLELQASYLRDKVEDALFYNISAKRSLGLPVRTAFILLRREADGSSMTGVYEDLSITFQFDVVRLWRTAPDVFLNGPIAMLPLVVVSDVDRASMPSIIASMAKRVEAEVQDIDRSTTWLEANILLGLKYDQEFARTLLAGVRSMRESSTYMGILEEGIAVGEAKGKAEGERNLLIIFGRQRLGEPDSTTLAILEKLDTERIEALALRLFEVETWDDLLKD